MENLENLEKSESIENICDRNIDAYNEEDINLTVSHNNDTDILQNLSQYNSTAGKFLQQS